MGADDPKKQEELRLLLQLTNEDVERTNERQWRVANYALLLDAAIVASREIMRAGQEAIPWTDTIILSSLAGALYVLSLFLIWRFETYKTRYRSRLVRFSQMLDPELLATARYRTKKDYATWKYDVDVLTVMGLVLTAACFLVEWVLYRS